MELASSIRLNHACFKANLFKTEEGCFTWLSHIEEGSNYIKVKRTHLHQRIKLCLSFTFKASAKETDL